MTFILLLLPFWRDDYYFIKKSYNGINNNKKNICIKLIISFDKKYMEIVAKSIKIKFVI